MKDYFKLFSFSSTYTESAAGKRVFDLIDKRQEIVDSIDTVDSK